MQIFDSLHSIYDKKACCCHCCSERWEVMETDKLATFKKLTIYMEGAIFGVVDNDFYKGLSKMTGERSTFMADKDCDGVSFCEYEGRIHLVLVDLKSSYKKVEDAFMQDFFTLMKMHMFLSVCKGYDIRSISIDFFAATPPCKDKDEESDILSRLNTSDMLCEPRFVDKCYLNHLYNRKSTLARIAELPFVKTSEFHESIMSSSVKFHIFTPDTFGESEGLLDLGLYFN